MTTSRAGAGRLRRAASAAAIAVALVAGLVAWPPDTVADSGKPVAGGRASASLLGTVADPNSSGDRVVTYDGWPLYTFTADSAPGQTNGQDLDNNRGLWFVMRPSGQIVRTPR